MQKARRHHMKWLRPLVGAWFQELFHSPRRGAFHLSLTVLVHYRSHGSIQPCRMVPADSHRVSRAPRYSGYRMPPRLFGYGAVILCGATFQTLPLETRQHDRGPTTPAPRRSHARRFGLVPVRSPLLGESLLFSLPGGTKMFQFPPFASLHQSSDNYPSGNWVVPFGNLGIKGYLLLPQAYRSLSRPSSPP